MRTVLGWWKLDAEGPRLVHAVTGQVLSYSGRVEWDSTLTLTRSHNRHWMRFDYQDRDVRYPLLVEWRNVPSERRGRPIVWRVDHIRSAALWRREADVKAVHPPFGLWQRVDACLSDALACWPELPTTGRMPRYIAINGGWFNGSWSERFYRCVWHGGEILVEGVYPAFHQAWMPALDAEPPSAWEFVGQIGSDDHATLLDWGFVRQHGTIVNLPPGSKLRGVERSRPHLRSKDGLRFVVPLSQRIDPGPPRLPRNTTYVRLLYVDPDIFTDCVEAHVWGYVRAAPVRWTIVLDAERSGLGVVRRAGGVRLDPVEFPPVRIPAIDAVATLLHLPYAVWLPLGYAVVDAWLLWADAEARLPGQDGRDLPRTRLDPAGMVFLADGILAGTSKGSRLEAALSVTEPVNGEPNPLAYMFDEEHDGILRVSKPSPVLGWWDFDPETTALVNRKSDQRVSFAGIAPDSRTGPWGEAPGTAEWRFIYEDRDIRYPLAVGRRIRRSGNWAAVEWSVDHWDSAEVWRRETGGAGSRPPYGLWRRVDDCVLDALLCWPEIEATGQKASTIRNEGGWLNGEWTQDVHGSVGLGCEPEVADPPSAEPILEPLDAPAPLPWRYFDAPEVARSAHLSFVTEIGRGRFHLPAEAPLTGFEQHMPHLKRADGRAVMFPAGLSSSFFRGEDYRSGPFFLYADEELFFRIHGGDGSDWIFEVGVLSRIGFRRPSGIDTIGRTGLPPDLFEERGRPTYALWRRLSGTLVDGWLNWTGTERRLLEDPRWLADEAKRGMPVPPVERSGISLARKLGVRIQGGYVAGLYRSTLSRTARRTGQKQADERWHARFDDVIRTMSIEAQGGTLPDRHGKLSRPSEIEGRSARVPKFVFGKRKRPD